MGQSCVAVNRGGDHRQVTINGGKIFLFPRETLLFPNLSYNTIATVAARASGD
jgi:hypothetical protein